MKQLIIPGVLLLFFSTINLFAQWLTDVRLTNDPALSRTSLNNARCISAYSDSVHVVWRDERDGNAEIYHKRSTNAGVSWGADTRLTNNSSDSQSPSVAVFGSFFSSFVVHVVWQDLRDGNEEIYYKRSTDGGVSWGIDTRLTNNSALSQFPSVAVFFSVVHVVWYDLRDGHYEVYYKRSTDGGISWSADTRLTNSTVGSVFPSVAVNNGVIVNVVWSDGRDGNDEIYYKISTDQGVSWGADTRLTNNTADKGSPSVSVGSSDVHVVWVDYRDGFPNSEIYYKRRNFDTWGADIRLTNNSGFSFNPSVSASGPVVHVVWQDGRDGNYEIYYKRSTDRGIIWSADTRLTNNSAVSDYPSISVSGQAVHVVWSDTRDGNNEIYYKRDPTGNPLLLFQSQFYKNNLNKPLIDSVRTRDTIFIGFHSSITYSVLDVNLQIDTVIHTNDSDLEFYLKHNGITDTVIYQVGGSGDNFIGTILNDSAASLISNGSAPFTGSYKPSKPLSQFNNGDVNGTWILEIFDRATGNIGILNAWSLVFTILQNPIGIQPVGNEIPEGFSLSQNYPNPFNPATKIKLALPKSSFAKLVVYDILGREIAILINEKLSPGTYEVQWDAADYPTGVYFYKLTTDGYSQTKKMMLVK